MHSNPSWFFLQHTNIYTYPVPKYQSSQFEPDFGNNVSNKACFNQIMTPKIAQRGDYWVYYNYIPAWSNPKCNETITFVANGDPTMLDTLPLLVKRWRGPISIALFTPGSDYERALQVTSYYRWYDFTVLPTFSISTVPFFQRIKKVISFLFF